MSVTSLPWKHSTYVCDPILIDPQPQEAASAFGSASVETIQVSVAVSALAMPSVVGDLTVGSAYYDYSPHRNQISI